MIWSARYERQSDTHAVIVYYAAEGKRHHFGSARLYHGPDEKEKERMLSDVLRLFRTILKLEPDRDLRKGLS